MTDTQPIPESIQKLLDTSLPNDGEQHTLVLGDRHKKLGLLKSLKTYLPKLNAQTIGLERRAFTNVFLWAYADGTLECELGSKEAAQDYLRAVFVASTKEKYEANAIAMADLTMAALDAGVSVIAYDSRDTLSGVKATWHSQLRALSETIDGESSEYKCSAAELRQHVRTSADNLNHMSQQKGPFFLWMLGEVDWLLTKNPKYGHRLSAIENLIETGHEKIKHSKLGGDALSACVFDSLSVPKSNRLAIIGLDHIDDIGSSPKSKIEYIHGTFFHHLSSLGKQTDCSTNRAVIDGGVGVDIPQRRYLKLSDHPTNTYRDAPIVVDNSYIPLINLDTNEVSTLPHKPENPKRLVSLKEKFSPENTIGGITPLSKKGRAAHTSAHINPLLMPDIKAAYDNVVAVMNHAPQSKER